MSIVELRECEISKYQTEDNLQSNSSNCSFENIFDDIVVNHILKNIDISVFGRLSCSSKHFEKIITGKSCWQSIVMSRFPHLFLPEYTLPGFDYKEFAKKAIPCLSNEEKICLSTVKNNIDFLPSEHLFASHSRKRRDLGIDISHVFKGFLQALKLMRKGDQKYFKINSKFVFGNNTIEIMKDCLKNDFDHLTCFFLRNHISSFGKTNYIGIKNNKVTDKTENKIETRAYIGIFQALKSVKNKIEENLQQAETIEPVNVTESNVEASNKEQ